MAPSPPDSRWRARLALLALAACAALPAARAEGPVAKRENIDVEGSHPLMNLNAGTLSLREVRLTQGPGTLIVANETHATGISGGYENSQWQFTGAVHIEFDGAVLDSDAATAVFADGRIKTLSVRGAPARFSHQAKRTGQRNQGRASTIDYDSASGQVRFSGGTWYSDGRNEASTETLVYDLNNSVLTSASDGGDGRVKLTIRPGEKDKRVTLPAPPDKDAAR